MSQPRVLLLGPPGAGKGTQSENVAAEYGVEHVATGDVFRENTEMDISHLDTEYDTPGEYMERGELVPDPVVDEMVADYLAELDGYVLDGYPRNEHQAEQLDSITDLDVVCLLSVSDSELVDRLTGRRLDPETGDIYHLTFDPPESAEVEERLIQREDDTEEVVTERLQVYEESTAPVVERYREQGLLYEVDGEGSPEEVWERLDAAIADAL